MHEVKQLLGDARCEILALRRDNELLGAQMAIVEVFAAALGLKKNQNGMSIDLVWLLEKKLKEIEDQEKPTP